MAKIPWFVYAIVGIGMVIAIQYLENERLNVFRWVAYAFVIIAVFKLLVSFMIGKKRDVIEPKLKPSDMPAEQMPKAAGVCKYCKSPLPPTGRFCPYCGARVRI